MKVGEKSLKMSSGEVRHFGSKGKRNRFEKVAQAVKHGWIKPKHKFKGFLHMNFFFVICRKLLNNFLC